MEKIIAAGSRATHLLVGGGIAWVLEVGSVDAGGVTAAGADHRVRHREGPDLRPDPLGGEREGGVAGQLPLDRLHPGAWAWAGHRLLLTSRLLLPEVLGVVVADCVRLLIMFRRSSTSEAEMAARLTVADTLTSQSGGYCGVAASDRPLED